MKNQRCIRTVLYRIFSVAILFIFLIHQLVIPTPGCAQVMTQIPGLPPTGSWVGLSGKFMPVLIKGLTIHPDNPLQFDFIVDTGETRIQGDHLKMETIRSIKYFLAALTIPEEDVWVNLSPYEKDRIIPNGFGLTEMGRDLLVQDYMLKQLTASLMYPEKELGKTFWNKIYEKAQKIYGTTDIPLDTFNKIWILPDQAVVYENNGSAFVVNSHLKVMLEEDYLAKSKLKDQKLKINPTPTTEVIREILIPEIEKEVNAGKVFANLRQIYHAMILATWYKQDLKKSLLGKVYVDQKKTKGIDTKDKEAKQKIYNQYLAAFKKGVYDYIREDYDPVTQNIVPRKYFSGGLVMRVSSLEKVIHKNDLRLLNPADAALLAQASRPSSPDSQIVSMRVNLLDIGPAGDPDKAILADQAGQTDDVRTGRRLENNEQKILADLIVQKVPKLRGNFRNDQLLALWKIPQLTTEKVGNVLGQKVVRQQKLTRDDFQKIVEALKQFAARLPEQSSAQSKQPQWAVVYANHNTKPNFDLIRPELDKALELLGGKKAKVTVLMEETVGMRLLQVLGQDIDTQYRRQIAQQGEDYLSNVFLRQAAQILISSLGEDRKGIARKIRQGELSMNDFLQMVRGQDDPFTVSLIEYLAEKKADSYDIELEWEEFDVISTLYSQRYDYFSRRVDEGLRKGKLQDYLQQMEESLRAIGHSAELRDKRLFGRQIPEILRRGRSVLLTRGTSHLGGESSVPGRYAGVAMNAFQTAGVPSDLFTPGDVVARAWAKNRPLENDQAQEFIKKEAVRCILEDVLWPPETIAYLKWYPPVHQIIWAVPGEQVQILLKKIQQLAMWRIGGQLTAQQLAEITLQWLYDLNIPDVRSALPQLLENSKPNIVQNLRGRMPFLFATTDHHEFDRSLRSQTEQQNNQGDRAMLIRPFGNTGYKFNILGRGTIHFGREWPIGNKNYKRPTDEELNADLNLVYEKMHNEDGVVMIDTAPAYAIQGPESGSEERIGKFLNEHPDLRQRTFLSTKVGEEAPKPGERAGDIIHPNVERLRASVERSFNRLGQIDILYLHQTTVEALQNEAYMKAFKDMKSPGNKYGIKLVGPSISNPDVLKEVVEKNLLQGMDVIQMPARFLEELSDYVDRIYAQGIAIVVNSPVRFVTDGRYAERYRKIADDPRVSVILLGTQNNLTATVGYFDHRNDAALLTTAVSTEEKSKSDVGGINLDPKLLDLQIKRDGKGIPLPVDQQPIGDLQVEGFMPVIIDVTPVKNLPLLLGLGDLAPQNEKRDTEKKGEMNLGWKQEKNFIVLHRYLVRFSWA